MVWVTYNPTSIHFTHLAVCLTFRLKLLICSWVVLDVIYQTVIFPQITLVTPSVSGLLGGQTVLITGSGFNANCANTVVSLGVANCTVTSCTSTTISCIVEAAAAPAQAPFASTTGLTLKLWWNWYYCYCSSTFAQNPNYPSNPATILTSLNGMQGYRYHMADNYIQQVRVHFNYVIYCTKKDFSFLVGRLFCGSIDCKLLFLHRFR